MNINGEEAAENRHNQKAIEIGSEGKMKDSVEFSELLQNKGKQGAQGKRQRRAYRHDQWIIYGARILEQAPIIVGRHRFHLLSLGVLAQNG